MKNQFLMLSLFVGITSCSTARRGSSATTPEKAPKPAASSTSPVFIEHITINESKSTAASRKTTSSRPIAASGSGSATGKNVELSEPLLFKYAILLNVPVEELTDVKLVETIESWYGTRYRFGGSDRNGIDCSAFAQVFMSSVFNIALPRTSIDQYNQSKRVRKANLQPGDLVFFATRGRSKAISHVGVYVRNNKFVHAATSGGVMISDLDDTYYAQHYAGGGRVL